MRLPPLRQNGGQHSEASRDRETHVATLLLTLDRTSHQPLVRQLYLRIRELILARRLPAGARLPSTRQLARELGVSRTVTLDAFGVLAAEGFLESRRGAGHFVAALRLLEPRVESRATARERVESRPSMWSASGRPFDPIWQAVDVFPGKVWGRMLGRGWRRHQAAAMERHWSGLPELRAALAEHLYALLGIPLNSDQIMVTSGTADAMTLIARSIERLGKQRAYAWVENPGYAGSARILAREGVKPIPVPVDSEGLRVVDGETLAPDAALAVVTATRQFPLGMPLSLRRRLVLLDWARRSGATIVDDDYDGEIRFVGRPLQSLASLDSEASVLTVGSFSRLTFPGLRLGYVAGPAEIIARLAECRRGTEELVPTSAQAALAQFIATGAFTRHLRQLRTYLTRRRQLLVEAIRREADGLLEILPQEAGMHLTVRLVGNIARRPGDIALAKQARAHGLVLMPLSQQYIAGDGEHGFLLGYAGWSDAELGEAANRFLKLLRDAAAS